VLVEGADVAYRRTYGFEHPAADARGRRAQRRLLDAQLFGAQPHAVEARGVIDERRVAAPPHVFDNRGDGGRQLRVGRDAARMDARKLLAPAALIPDDF
jgi:hypothetical protein